MIYRYTKALNQIEEVTKTIVKRFDKKSEVALEILGNILAHGNTKCQGQNNESGLH